MDRAYLRSNEMGDLLPLCKFPEDVCWRFKSTSSAYEVEVFREGKMLLCTGECDQPYMAVKEAIRQWRELPPEKRGEDG